MIHAFAMTITISIAVNSRLRDARVIAGTIVVILKKLQYEQRSSDTDLVERQNPMIQKMRRLLAGAIVLLTTTVSLSANDVAQFANLGFSPDSRVFMFAQYGIHGDSGQPFAEIYTVDVPGNVFTNGGVARETFTTPITPGQDGRSALYSLLPEVQDQVSRHRIDHINQGRLIYLFVNGEEPRSQIEFRDFESGNRYSIVLEQDSQGEGETGRAAFYLDVALTLSNGRRYEHRVGRPGFFRDGVSRYRILQAILAPDDRSLVVVVERITDTATGARIRYMVETVRLY